MQWIRRLAATVPLALLAASCGGGGGAAQPEPDPAPSPGIVGTWLLQRSGGYPVWGGGSFREFSARISIVEGALFVDLRNVPGWAPDMGGSAANSPVVTEYLAQAGLEWERWTWTVEGDAVHGTIVGQYFFGDYDLEGPIVYAATDTFEGVRMPDPVPLSLESPGTVEFGVTGVPSQVAWFVRGGCTGSLVYAEVDASSGPLPAGLSLTVEESPNPAYEAVVRVKGEPRVAGSFNPSHIRVGHATCWAADEVQVRPAWQITVGPVVILDTVPASVPAASYEASGKYDDVSGLPDAVFNQGVSVGIDAAGGVPPYSAAIVDDPADPDDGPLPGGVTLLGGNQPVLLGSPVQLGPAGRPFRFRVAVTDSQGETAARTFQWRITTPDIVILDGTLPQATAGVSYTHTIQVVDGVPPFTFSVTAGSLPAGLSLEPGTGKISGVPITAGSGSFTVTVASQLVTQSTSKELTLTVN